MIDTPSLETKLREIVDAPGAVEVRRQKAVEAVASAFEARTCTLHRAEADEPVLHLLAFVGLPPQIIEVTRKIPIGKGMAGICAQRREPVTVCNLQTDESGVARPAAKETRVAGALVIPILRDGEVLGTLGVGKAGDHEYDEAEIRALESCGAILARTF